MIVSRFITTALMLTLVTSSLGLAQTAPSSVSGERLQQYVQIEKELAQDRERIVNQRSNARRDLVVGLSLIAASVIFGLAGTARGALGGLGTTRTSNFDWITNSFYVGAGGSLVGASFAFHSRREAKVTLTRLINEVGALKRAEQALLENTK